MHTAQLEGFQRVLSGCGSSQSIAFGSVALLLGEAQRLWFRLSMLCVVHVGLLRSFALMRLNWVFCLSHKHIEAGQLLA